MSDDEVFAQLTAGLEGSRDLDAVMAVYAAMGPNGELTKAVREQLQTQLGCSQATLYRYREKALTLWPSTEPEPVNSFEALERFGAKGFFFDEPMRIAYKAVGCNARALSEELVRLGYPRVSEATISRRLHELPPRVRDGDRNGHKNRYRFQLTRCWESAAPYELAQVDEFQFPVDVLVPLERGEQPVDEDGEKVEVYQPDGPGGRKYRIMRARLLLLIDAYSRFILSFAVLYKPAANMYDTLALLGDAMLRRKIHGHVVGGSFASLGSDNGGALVGQLVATFMDLVGTDRDIAIGYCPQMPSKAKIEANGGSFKRLVSTGIPGVRSSAETVDGYDLGAMDASNLLRSEQFTAHVKKQVEYWNYERRHSATDEIPFQRLVAHGAQGLPVPDVLLAQCFLPNDQPRPDKLIKNGQRKVDKDGVKLRDGLYHQSPAFFDYVDRKVEIRTLHHSDDYTAAFTLSGEFLALVPHPRLWTEDDTKQCSARAREATASINRVARSTRDCIAAAGAQDPENLRGGAVGIAISGTEVPRTKSARRAAARPEDTGPRRVHAFNAVAEEARSNENLSASLAAMELAAHHSGDDADSEEADL